MLFKLFSHKNHWVRLKINYVHCGTGNAKRFIVSSNELHVYMYMNSPLRVYESALMQNHGCLRTNCYVYLCGGMVEIQCTYLSPCQVQQHSCILPRVLRNLKSA